MPTSGANTGMTDDDLLIVKTTQNASTQTPDCDLSFLAEIAECHGHIDGHKIICPSKLRASQVFDQDSAESHHVSSVNINNNKDDFQIMNNDRCNNATIGPLTESINDSYIIPFRRTCLEEQPTNDGFQNIPYRDKMFKRQRAEYAEKMNEEGKLNFAGSSSFLSENSMPDTYPVSSNNLNKLEDSQERSDSCIVLDGKRNNSSIIRSFLGNAVIANSNPKQEVHKSRDVAREKASRLNLKLPVPVFVKDLHCGKCGKWFMKESELNVHLRRNCDPKPYKCDKCDEKFSFESPLLRHCLKHTTERPFKCDQCAHAAKRNGDLKAHKASCH